MEMIVRFGEKIHVQKDIHRIKLFDELIDGFHRENYLLYLHRLLIDMVTNKYDTDIIDVFENNLQNKEFFRSKNLSMFVEYVL